MRTTIRLDDELLRAAKRRAAETRSTLASVIEDALRQALQAPPPNQGLAPLPTAPGAPRPGVDLDDSASLLDLMEGR